MLLALFVVYSHVFSRPFKVMQEDYFKDRWGYFYSDYKQRSRMHLIPLLLFPIRRIALLSVSLFLGYTSSLQLVLTNSINLVFSLYFLHYRPHSSKLLNQIEIFNEVIITLCGIHFLAFSEFVEPSKARVVAGYSLIILITFALLVNASIYLQDLSRFFKVAPIRLSN